MARKSASTSAWERTVGKRFGLVGRLRLSSHGNSIQFKHLAVEEKQCRQSLLMRRSRHLEVGGQMAKKCPDFVRPHLP